MPSLLFDVEWDERRPRIRLAGDSGASVCVYGVRGGLVPVGMWYVGQTRDIYRRVEDHMRGMRRAGLRRGCFVVACLHEWRWGEDLRVLERDWQRALGEQTLWSPLW
jgi:predicted GIY-YIG superfamily endonuclease